MKTHKLLILLLVCILIPALPLAAWFRATTDAEIWPPISGEEVKYRFLVEVGRPLAQPAYFFVNQVMTRIDFMYSCAGAWHPVFRISFAILSIGYSGSLFLGCLAIRTFVLRQNYQAEQAAP